jgi:hypothetical protein
LVALQLVTELFAAASNSPENRFHSDIADSVLRNLGAPLAVIVLFRPLDFSSTHEFRQVFLEQEIHCLLIRLIIAFDVVFTLCELMHRLDFRQTRLNSLDGVALEGAESESLVVVRYRNSLGPGQTKSKDSLTFPGPLFSLHGVSKRNDFRVELTQTL